MIFLLYIHHLNKRHRQVSNQSATCPTTLKLHPYPKCLHVSMMFFCFCCRFFNTWNHDLHPHLLHPLMIMDFSANKKSHPSQLLTVPDASLRPPGSSVPSGSREEQRLQDHGGDSSWEMELGANTRKVPGKLVDFGEFLGDTLQPCGITPHVESSFRGFEHCKLAINR